MRRWTGLLLAAWLCVVPAAGAAVPESPKVRLIGVADGLPSSNVNGMAQDRAGYLWIATTDGLARYDGVGFRVWRHVQGERTSLPGNYVTAVHVDAGDRVWVAVEGRGLSVLGAARRGFRHYRQINHPQIGSDDTWAITSHRGALWFGTFGGGLHRLDRSGRITRFMPNPGDARSLPADTVLSLSVDGRGTLWVGTPWGLARWTGRDFEPIALPGAASATTIYSITPDGDAIWVGAKCGLYRREADGRWTRPAWSSMFAWPNAVFGVVADRGGYWLASHRNLWRVLPGGAPQPMPIGEHGPTRPMYQMLRQSNGAIWMPVAGAGLGYLRPDWRRIATFSRDQGGLASELYRGVAASGNGAVWLAGQHGEVERLAADGTLSALPASLKARIQGRRPISIAEDRKGRLWIGERSALVRIDLHGELREWPSASASDAPPSGPIDLLRAAPDGSVWLSSSGAGVQQRDADSGRVLTAIPTGTSHGLGVGDIEAMEVAPDGALWVAGGDGLARWDRRAGRLRPVAGIVPGDRVFGFAFDGADTLWLQRLAGLEHYRRSGKSWRLVGRVGPEDGIPALEGSGLTVDRHHRVWLTSLRGLYRWDARTRRVKRIDLQDGLTSQEFADHAMTLTDTGVLVAALSDGSVALVDTLAEDPPPTRPTLVWDRIDVRRDARWHALDSAAPALRPDDRELRVRLRLLAYESPAGNRYFTHLDGYDAHWVEQGGSGERVFAALAPGTYKLRARAVDAAGNPAREQVLDLRVLPPWWRTPWAYAAFCGLLILATWTAAWRYRARLERRRRDLQTQHEHELANAASMAKTRFLATLGHEIRTPMTGVLGMSELLLETPLDNRQRRYARSIRTAGEHLLRLMDDALDLARIEAGKLQLEEARLDLRELMGEVWALMDPLARQRGLDFQVEVESGMPRAVFGDARRLRQILLNLVGNAIKFTERGQVRLLVSAAAPADASSTLPPADGGSQGVRFDVVDTGPGLNCEQKARLFRRFEQAEGVRTAARYGGSGLGLAICQELAAAMHGSIEVRSVPGLGTRFIVRLPLRHAMLPDPPRSALPGSLPACSRRILLVEDAPTVAEVVAGLLRGRGHHVTHAGHGLAALTEVASAAFDMALLDLDLPGMDGFALAKALRAQGFAAPLVALTARADADAERESAQAGFDHFIRKPVTGAMLGALIEECCVSAG